MAENQQYQDDEIYLRELLVSITSRKKFIIGFTATVTVLAILSAFLITPTYKSSISFLSPSQSSVIALNRINRLTSETTETSETIYHKFLNKFLSREFQRKVFDKNDYLAKLNPKNKPIDNLDDFFDKFSEFFILQLIKADKNVEKINYEKPVTVTIEGSNAQVIADYLNDLASSADKETIDEFLSVIEQKTTIRLEEIPIEIMLLEEYHDKERNNQIKELLHHLAMAKELEIKNNNLGSKLNMVDFSLIIDSSNYDMQKLPKWYLFGEKALTKEIELLKTKKYSFIQEISKLEIERTRLESLKVSNIGINSVQIIQKAFIPNKPIKPKKMLIVSVAAVAGFVFSIILALLMNAFRTREIS